METNWLILTIIAVAIVLLIIYLIYQNEKDKKDLTDFLNRDYRHDFDDDSELNDKL